MGDTASSITELHIRDAGLVGAAAPSMEEVQPNVAVGEPDFAEWNSSEPRDANMPEAVQKHDARRCHICGAKFPPFGFGPLLIQREFPRLCRGGSQSLTDPEVYPVGTRSRNDRMSDLTLPLCAWFASPASLNFGSCFQAVAKKPL
jgi:hypothetical protein